MTYSKTARLVVITIWLFELTYTTILYIMPRLAHVGYWPFLVPAVLALPTLVSLGYFVNVEGSNHGLNTKAINDRLEEDVQKMVVAAQIKGQVIVKQIDADVANAYAVSSPLPWDNRSFILFTNPLIEALDYEQILAVTAHEIAHIQNGDSKGKAYIEAFHRMVGTYPRLMSEFVKRQIWFFIFIFLFFLISITFSVVSGFKNFPIKLAFECLAWIIGGGLAYVGGPALEKLFKRIHRADSHAREFAADKTGARLYSTEYLIAALNRLSELVPSAGDYCDTHPPIRERIKRLEGLTPRP